MQTRNARELLRRREMLPNLVQLHMASKQSMTKIAKDNGISRRSLQRFDMFVLRCRCIFVGQVKLYLGFFFLDFFRSQVIRFKRQKVLVPARGRPRIVSEALEDKLKKQAAREDLELNARTARGFAELVHWTSAAESRSRSQSSCSTCASESFDNDETPKENCP
jgi:hypothetical protein